jgi:hypothetical protein
MPAVTDRFFRDRKASGPAAVSIHVAGSGAGEVTASAMFQ